MTRLATTAVQLMLVAPFIACWPALRRAVRSLLGRA